MIRLRNGVIKFTKAFRERKTVNLNTPEIALKWPKNATLIGYQEDKVRHFFVRLMFVISTPKHAHKFLVTDRHAQIT